ncbi:MAG: bifunctional N(6)-L-threonylcarbamoyladenine synthase/serine/threonine protein kinase [Promethearchaeota archaeon]
MVESKEAIILGIEGTAHTAGISVIEGKRILSDVQAIFQPKEGGIHPREAARFLGQNIPKLIHEAIAKTNLQPEDLSAIAFSQGPGLGPCLRAAATAARALALYLEIPLLGVNHCVAHVELGKLLTEAADPITLYVSGGNTQIIGFGHGRYRVLGETLDIAVGNALDSIARGLGLHHPGGPLIEKYAQKGKRLLSLPYPIKGMSLSYSGFVTAATRLYHEQQGKLEDLCFSIQEYAFGMLAEVTERAISCTEKKEVLLTGGVAANKRLREMIENVAKEQEVSFYCVPPRLAGDNGVMIAWTGKLLYDSKTILPIPRSQVIPRWRIDEVSIPWLTNL